MKHSSLAVAAAALTTTLVTTAGLLGSGGSAHATFPAANGRIAFAADAGQGSETLPLPFLVAVLRAAGRQLPLPLLVAVLRIRIANTQR